MRWFTLGVWLSAVAFLLACLGGGTDSETVHGGGGTDTETLTGFVVDTRGQPLPNARIKIFSSGYDPSGNKDSHVFTTVRADSNGGFTIPKSIPNGDYRLIAADSNRNLWGTLDFLWAGDTAAHLKVQALPPRLYRFALESSIYLRSDSGVAYFPGTDILAHCRSGTIESVDSVPATLNRLVIRSRAGWQHDSVLVNLPDTVTVHANVNNLIITQ
jgi:protocatechuate 3,4-dioxygenase beta subunit